MKVEKYKIINGIIHLVVILACCLQNIQAQNPAPALPQTKPIVLTGATIHTGNGQVIENGILGFDKGIITMVLPGDQVGSIWGKGDLEIIDVKGKHIFPGLISLNTTVGLQEIASVRATLDYAEVGQINPHVRALVAYNTDSEVIPTLRGNGILLSQAVPQGGQSLVLHPFFIQMAGIGKMQF
ncbi:hypothetical protein [Dyadobacter sp. NIV53]|uniref:hypothetical protein n=1 Tax=Dyadobacter sp. NIV53 TaxID=2861765 RepID=UPI00286E3B23|nr:hypothetical protein [Dyadobacter sp. NIV53]